MPTQLHQISIPKLTVGDHFSLQKLMAKLLTSLKRNFTQWKERLSKVRIANAQAEPRQDGHCIHMISVLVKNMFFFREYHLFQCHSHANPEVTIYFGIQTNKRINVKNKYFKTSWYKKSETSTLFRALC